MKKTIAILLALILALAATLACAEETHNFATAEKDGNVYDMFEITKFNFGDSAAVPVLKFRNSAPEDRAVFAGILETLHRAGLDADPEEISARFGLSLKRTQAVPEVRP